MNKPYLFFHTVRHLKPIQLLDRFRRKFKIIDFDVATTPSNRDLKNNWIEHELLESSYISEDKYKFLNVEGNVGTWNDVDKSKLWLYNLHYFDDLNALDSFTRIEQNLEHIERWIIENPPNEGNGWEPYPLSLRIVNWVKFFLKTGRQSEKSRNSLYLQAHVLSQTLEYHLLGNHLFSNAKALIFAGSYFSGPHANSWLEKGLEILDSEIDEQIQCDGSNFELSPMYHNIILTDMLDLYNLANAYDITLLKSNKNRWRNLISKMLRFSEAMSHPDGEVSFFNDSAMGIAPVYEKLQRYAENLGLVDEPVNPIQNSSDIETEYFSDAGYIVVRNNEFKAILDTAKIGPDYIPGHAHADTLSFELSLFGERVFVNTGTSEYGVSEERLRQRKTAAHNTVDVDGFDSSEVWSGFRVAKRAYPTTPIIRQTPKQSIVSSSHDGYQRLKGSVIHKREWSLGQKQVVVSDSLLGQYKQAFAHYHLHPSIQVSVKDKLAKLTLDCGKDVFLESSTQIMVQETKWNPEFGVNIPTKKLLIPVLDSYLTVSIRF